MDIVDKKIISIGGGGFTHQTDKFLDEFIINQIIDRKIKFGFLPTASKDNLNKINLYYVLAITPAASQRDRFVFDGEVPFGISVNQVPPTGNPTHFKHGISADLRTLSEGNEYDFAYSLRNAREDSITTLKMVHDMQTNLVYMKRSVLLHGVITDIPDSNSKS